MLWKAGEEPPAGPARAAEAFAPRPARATELRQEIHRISPGPTRKERAFRRGAPLAGTCPDRVRFPLHRARSASRSKSLLRAVGRSRKAEGRKFPGEADESATGSVNFFAFGACDKK